MPETPAPVTPPATSGPTSGELAASTPTGEVRVRVARARPADLDAITALMLLVSPDEPIPATLPFALALPTGRLTHGDCLCLTARHGNQVVGTLIASPPQWAFEHALGWQVAHSILYISAVAVAAGHRRQGIATRLLATAEQHARHAHVRLLALDHRPALTGLYTRRGYRTGQDRLILALPGKTFHEQRTPGHLSAVKPLAPGITLTDVPGAPAKVVTGLVPGSQLPPHARYPTSRAAH